MKKNNKFGFTLVELLAVIVILAIILVIAVPQIMSTIEESRNGAFSSSAKLIASSAETLKLTNDTLGIEKTINCADVAEYNNDDYQSCSITFDEGEAQVTLAGKGKFAGKYVCNGTRTNAVVTEEECGTSDKNGITAVSYIEELLAKESTEHNGLQQTNATNGDTTYDAGIRYVGATDVVANKVYFNCEPTDGTNAYGTENYKYDEACEKWRIIGVFDVEDGSGNTEKRIKIINTESTFKASWDSSASSGANAANSGYGINQWGPSTLTDADGNEQPYAGADLMQLLNGYYIGKSGSECKYNNTLGQDGFGQTCTTESLTNAKMKPLTSNALSMIEDAVWYTYATNIGAAATAYLQERGISQQYTGKSECASVGGSYCNDKVNRTTTWTGLVGLMSVYDIYGANGWLYAPGTEIYSWSISPGAYSDGARYVWVSGSAGAAASYTSSSRVVWPALYLASNVQIISGDGQDEPYRLKA